ncbi:hypothetical protein L6452_13455 [Arctium lappa]|uniref:Uncharacterized protein n=1 Tax=Arctium lappa TaxID=4217 RepID=A0ACB9CID3_ARCLA|nr:hypothetical protein L6452_13455 [Arctium lappa]
MRSSVAEDLRGIPLLKMLRRLSSIRFERCTPSLSSSADLRLHRTFSSDGRWNLRHVGNAFVVSPWAEPLAVIPVLFAKCFEESSFSLELENLKIRHYGVDQVTRNGKLVEGHKDEHVRFESGYTWLMELVSTLVRSSVWNEILDGMSTCSKSPCSPRRRLVFLESMDLGMFGRNLRIHGSLVAIFDVGFGSVMLRRELSWRNVEVTNYPRVKRSLGYEYDVPKRGNICVYQYKGLDSGLRETFLRAKFHGNLDFEDEIILSRTFGVRGHPGDYASDCARGHNSLAQSPKLSTHGTILAIVPAIVPWHNRLAQ